MRSMLRRVLLAAILFVSVPVLAADPLAISEGTVKSIDKTKSTITLSHGPLTNLGMPGMTMPFAVQDKAWLEKFKPGDKVRFRVEEGEAGYTIVRIEAAS